MRRYLLFIITLFSLSIASRAQYIQLSPEADVSVLTCGPSKQVYAMYGHTAIRVEDPVRNIDLVFNYGVFSFNAPHFIYRFAKGQTDYMLAIEQFDDFYEQYTWEGRSIYEQVLNLTQQEKQQILDFLIVNAQPENREYRYNFFYDNCATRVRDVLQNEVNGEIDFPVDDGEDRTFRQHVTDYQEVLPWVNFGIQLTLGTPADKVATAYEEMFLPDYLMKHLSNTEIVTGESSRPLIKESKELLEASNEAKSLNILTPFVVLSVLCLLVIYISYRQYKQGTERYLIDYLLLFVTGLIGVAALWFVLYSEHPAMHPNYNIWWAVPLNFPFLFLWMVKKFRTFLQYYWILLSGWLLLFFLLSAFATQAFHIGFYLIALMMFCRSLLHSISLLKNRKSIS